MSRVRQTFFLEVLKHDLICFAVYMVLTYFLGRITFVDVVGNGFYVFLIFLLRSTYISPVWNFRLKWTILVAPVLEASMYGGGISGHVLALISLIKYVMHYGYVLDWNPVFSMKDTFGNHAVQEFVFAGICCLLASFKVQAFILIFALSLQSFFIQWRLVDSVAESSLGLTRECMFTMINA